MSDGISKQKLNILIISTTQWSDAVAMGNTLSNFFGDWNDANFSSLYLRVGLPQNTVCSEYYNITEKQILKNLLKPNNIGQRFTAEQLAKKPANKTYDENISKESKERKIQKTLLKYFGSGFLLAIELLWKTGRWKNKKLDKFLEKDIDIIFAPAANTIYLDTVVNYCLKKTGAKLILYFGDDVYGFKSKAPLKYLLKKSLRSAIQKTVNDASTLYGASQRLCDEYGPYFGREIEPLYKGGLLGQYEVKSTVAEPIKIVYAGNLFYKRWQTLEVLAKEIDKINRDSEKIRLEIYTTAAITPKLDKALNKGTASEIMGARPYEEIKKILAGADIVLHVESFEKTAIETTRLSFSTKIIDCMQSGSCMMAIGPSCVASMEYLESVESVIVLQDLIKIGTTLEKIIENPQTILLKAHSLRNFAEEHHNINNVRKKLRSDFEALREK